MVGFTPIRPNSDGVLPVPGDGRYEWNGYLDRDLLLAGNDHFPNELYFDPETARQLEDRKEWVAKVVKIVRLMPDIAAVASSVPILVARRRTNASFLMCAAISLWLLCDAA